MIKHSDDIIAAEGPEREALAAVNAFMDAWNRSNIDGMDAAMNFPHVRLASGQVRLVEKPPFSSKDSIDRLIRDTGWAYSCWDYRHAVQSCPDKVHFAVQFTRYRADGSVIGVYPSMWIVTLKDGHWGVQARSSFAP